MLGGAFLLLEYCSVVLQQNIHRLWSVLYIELFISNSQLPDFLGGSCTCPNEGGCLGSNKGPWNDAQLMKAWISSFASLFTD